MIITLQDLPGGDKYRAELKRSPWQTATRSRRKKIKKTHASAWVGATEQGYTCTAGIAAAAADLHTNHTSGIAIVAQQPEE